MDGYELMAQGHEMWLKKNNIEESAQSEIKRQITALRMLSGKTRQDIESIFETGAFNDLCKAYAKKAMKNCGLTDKKIEEVMEELRWLFDTVEAAAI